MPREETVAARLATVERTKVELAADVRGETLSSFVRQAALDAAEKALEEARRGEWRRTRPEEDTDGS